MTEFTVRTMFLNKQELIYYYLRDTALEVETDTVVPNTENVAKI